MLSEHSELALALGIYATGLTVLYMISAISEDVLAGFYLGVLPVLLYDIFEPLFRRN